MNVNIACFEISLFVLLKITHFGDFLEKAWKNNYIIHPYKGNEAIVANNKTVLTRNNPQRI